MSENTTPRVGSVLDGLLNRGQLATAMDCCGRTIDTYVQAGCPSIKLGARRFFDPEAVRAWVLSHAVDRTPRRPGRPLAKRAAAG